ncbi:MAG TPA: secretin N-terminal domain-containing protein, partial [Nitrospiria bacterium]|nr:secretin N-terminal domain-containing protein [Nitrospiria bacterium]
MVPWFALFLSGTALGQPAESTPGQEAPKVIIQTPETESPKVITPSPTRGKRTRLITLDFNNVELPVFVKFVSEIVGKNFIIDERVRGKVTIFSPAKISVENVYEVFLSVLALKGLAAIETGEMVQILPVSEVPPGRDIHVYYLQNANAEETSTLLTSLVTRVAAPPRAGRPTPASATVGGTGQFEGAVQIIPDKATNALIITASPNDYELLKKVIQKLDIQRRQVYVEAVIMEVAQDRLRDIGTDLGVVAGYQNPGEDFTVIGGFNQAPEDILALDGL